MTTRATGTFDVKLEAQSVHNEALAATLSRRSIDKQFHGDLEATSRGEMLAAGAPQKGSAGYVAIERVEGVLHGRKGSFVLQHSSTMNRGSAHQNVSVIPDSGTDELTGLSGSMVIIIEQGKHSYEFDYRIE